MEKLKSIQDFLTLPDWIKVQLKISERRYSSYPFMTEDEEQNRKEKIYKIAAHFSHVPFEELTENPNYTLDDTWPYILEKYLTPKLIGVAPINFWNRFGFCYFCAHWKGYKKIHHRLMWKSKFQTIIPLSGHCRAKKNPNDARRTLITNSFFCCNSWLPEKLYQKIISIEIEKMLNQKGSHYKYEDYVYDLHNVNLWDYFFDKYSGIYAAHEEVY